MSISIDTFTILSALNHWWSSKNPFCKIFNKVPNVWQKKLLKNCKIAETSVFIKVFRPLLRLFLLFRKTVISGSRRFFWCVTRLYLKKLIFFIFICDLYDHCFWRKQDIFWKIPTNFVYLCPKATLEQQTPIAHPKNVKQTLTLRAI